MPGYVKVFRQIFNGSLYGQFEPTVVFLAMLVLAEKGGIVDMTPEAIAAKAGYPLDIVLKGIAKLEMPDERSRTPDEEGRRIIPLEDGRSWGWKITNFEKYDKVRSAEERRDYLRVKQAERRSRLRASHRDSQQVTRDVNNVNHVSTVSTSSALDPKHQPLNPREDDLKRSAERKNQDEPALKTLRGHFGEAAMSAKKLP